MPIRISRRQFVGSGLAATGAIVSGCCPCTLRTNHTWNNAQQIDGVDPTELAEPSSLAGLVALVRRAEAHGLGIRMVGSGHSFSDVAKTEGLLLRPKRLGRPLELDRSQLRDDVEAPERLFRMESGATVREINETLRKAGFALQNMGGYDAQTIVGAASTGTHGSGLLYGPLAEQIVSMQLVTTAGSVLQVEPTAGITDPSRFKPSLDSNGTAVPVELVQDDDMFNALSVSFGCMGIVYSVVVRTEPLFWLKEIRELTTWGAITREGGFLRNLLAGADRLEPSAAVDPVYYEVYVNPYPPAGKSSPADHACILTKRYKLGDKPALSKEDEKRGRYGTSIVATIGEVTGQGEALADFMNEHPEQAPFVIQSSLESLEDRSYVDLSYKVFNLGPPNYVRAYGIEVGFDIQQSIMVTERLFQIARELRAEDIMHNTPPSLRFVKNSPAHLAMMHGRDSMMLEMGMVVCANGADHLLRTYETRFREEFGGRPHWGLDLNTLGSFDQVRTLYPDSAERWLSVYRRLNSRGTFNGPVTERLGISMPRNGGSAA